MVTQDTFLLDEAELDFQADFEQDYKDLEYELYNPDWREDDNATSADFPGPSDTENEEEPDPNLAWNGHSHNYDNYDAEMARGIAIQERRQNRQKRHFFRALETKRAEDKKRFEDAMNAPFSWHSTERSIFEHKKQFEQIEKNVFFPIS